MKLTIDFEKKQIIFTGNGSWIDFAECVQALESIDYGNEEGWSVSFRGAEIPQLSSLFDRMSKPYNPPENPFKNPSDFYREFPKTNDPIQYPPNIVYCGDPLVGSTGTANTVQVTSSKFNYDQFNQ